MQTLPPEQEAFVQAYGRCCADEDDATVRAFFTEDAFGEPDRFTNKHGTGAYSSIMDAHGIWKEAIRYAKENA